MLPPSPIRPGQKIFIAFAIACIAGGGALSSFAAVLNVPSEFATVQEAIDTAANGDEIIVAPGVYVENLRMNGRNVNLHSIDPTDWEVVNATILEGGGRTDVITFSGSENETCRIAGFRITGGGFQHSSPSEAGSGIKGNGTTALIEHNHITGNFIANTVIAAVGPTRAWRGGGLRSCDGVIQNNVIDFNAANIGGGLYDCNGLIQNNIIARNRLFTLRFGSGQIIDNFGAAMDSCNGIIRNNTIIDNMVERYPFGQGLVLIGGGLTNCQADIANNIVWHTEEGLGVEFENSSLPEFCDIKGWTGGGEGNISADPMLRDVVFEGSIPFSERRDNDYGLRPDSPCIDAGREIPDLTTDNQGQPRGRDWIPEGVGDGSNYDIGAEEFTPGPVTLWIPGGPMPVNGGEIVDVQWVLQPEAGQTIQLSLELDGVLQADLGEFTSPTGDGLEMLQIPMVLVGSDNYIIQGTSTLVPELVGETRNFTIQGPPPNAIDPRFWKLYGDLE